MGRIHLGLLLISSLCFMMTGEAAAQMVEAGVIAEVMGLRQRNLVGMQQATAVWPAVYYWIAFAGPAIVAMILLRKGTIGRWGKLEEIGTVIDDLEKNIKSQFRKLSIHWLTIVFYVSIVLLIAVTIDNMGP